MSNNTVRKRSLTVETLEARELLSVTLDASGDAFRLHSDSASHHVIYLDFNGHVTSGTWWNDQYRDGEKINTPAFSIDSESAFSTVEIERIKEIWQRVAEDFAPFDVDVTTEEPTLDKLLKTSSNDNDYGIRVVIGGNASWLNSSSNTTGIAYPGLFGSYDWDYRYAYSVDMPAFVFSATLNGNAKAIAETVSHEAGHTLGLNHDGTAAVVYYSGANGWGTIMGSSNDQTLTQWSRGEYPNANNQEDDLAIISTFIPYRKDDHGNAPASATTLVITGNVFSGTGIIERNTDYDYFKFTLSANSTLNINISPAALGPNLDILAGLFDSSGDLIVQKDDQNSLGADFMDLSLDAGTYYLAISGTGKNTGTNGIYSRYGSLGTYSVSGLITAVTGPPVVLPDAGTVVLVPNKEPRQARVEWNAVIQDTATVQTVYVVQYRVKGTERWKSVIVRPAKTVQTGNLLGKTLTLKSGTEYEIQIYAKAANGENKAIVEEPFYKTSVKTYSVISKAVLSKVPVEKFHSPDQLAIRVKNYQTVYGQGTIKNVIVDTVTVTYTFGKTKTDKVDNHSTETLTFIDGVWTGGTAVTFVDGIIVIRDLKPYTLYTVTVQFGGPEAVAAKVSSISVRTAKASWSIPIADIVLTSTEVDGKQNIAVSWSAAGDDYEQRPDVYTVKVYTTNLRLVRKVTVRNAALEYEVTRLKLGVPYSISVTPNADATHFAATESDRVAVTY